MGQIQPLPRPRGDTYVIKGEIPADYTQHKITLFDGQFDTAFRVVQFIIAPVAVANHENQDYIAKLTTDELEYSQPAGVWHWSDNSEIGWASTQSTGVRELEPQFALMDPENLIIEDLYISATTNDDAPDNMMNYMIVMEKYKITQAEGTLTYIRNRGQNV